MLAWLRRIIVSIGIGGFSYALMLGIMVLSVVYDRQLEPVVNFAFDTGRQITNTLDSLVSGTYWGQVAVNHLRERVNMTHVVLSIPAIVIAAIVVGIPLNWLLGGTRTALQRISMAVVSVPATLLLAVALFTFNALVPDTYAALLRFADWIWQGSLNALSHVMASELDGKVPRETVRRLDDDCLGAIFGELPKHVRETWAFVDWVGTAHSSIVILIGFRSRSLSRMP